MADEVPAAAVSAAIAAAGPLLPLRDAEQLELLRDDRGELDRVAARRAARGVGRPPGSANKRTKDVRDYLLSRYAHPLEVLAQIISRPIDQIVAETGCKPIEALALVKSAAAELAPYVEGKMPVAVDLSVRGDMTLAIEGLTHSAEEIRELAQAEFVEVDDDDPETADFRDFSEGDQ